MMSPQNKSRRLSLLFRSASAVLVLATTVSVVAAKANETDNTIANSQTLVEAESKLSAAREDVHCLDNGGAADPMLVESTCIDAIKLFTAVINANPKSSQAFFGRARAYQMLCEDPCPAGRELSELLQKPRRVEDDATLKKKAIADYDQALKLNPKLIEAHSLRARLTIDTNPQEALLHCNLGLAGPNRVTTLRTRARANEALGKLKDAIKDCSLALTLCPIGTAQRGGVLRQRADLYKRSNDLPMASADEEALKNLPAESCLR